MAVLDPQSHDEIWSEYMVDISSIREEISISKGDLHAAVVAVDAWIENNQASFNASLPQPARAELTAKQKVRLFMAVARRRYEVT